MTPDRLRRIEELYFLVASLPASERGTTLGQAAGDDPGLIGEVESLLGYSGATDSFLETPAIGVGVVERAVAEVVPEAPDAMIGRVVGAYRISERIASGGMGTVYAGVRADGAFDQRVAIKIVKRGMDTDEIVQRFRLERQTLAHLDHPNIAKLVDGGTTADGRPYLVMEYVQGLPIDRYCAENQLDVPARLRLFLQVCRAVQRAHQSLVVHRDLKPSNILVTTDGAPKLLDFGIVKVLQGADTAPEEARTITGQHRLTPEYASPEQVLGLPVTTSSDVYSLGVVLYELLSGERPYRLDTGTAAEITHAILHVDPLPPSDAARRATPPLGGTRLGVANRGAGTRRARRRLRGDIDTIVLKALRKEPARRYPSVEQFAGDIERYLGGMPITARKDTFTYRADRFIRRHAVGTVAGACVALALVLGGLGVAWKARDAARERDAAFLARDQAEQIAKFLKDTIASVDPALAGPEASVRNVLESGATRVDAELGDQPLVHAAVLATIGEAYLGLGLLSKAEECIVRAMEERRRILGDFHHDMAESRLGLAGVRYAQGRYAEAEPLLREALRIFRSIRGEHNLDIARTMNDLGAVLRAQGDLAAAEALYGQVLEIRRPHDGGDSLPVAETLNNLAGVLRAKGDMKGAMEALTESLRIRRLHLPPTHALVAQSLSNLATFRAFSGDYQGAESMFREAAAAEETSLGADHPEHAVTLMGLATVLLHLGEVGSREALVESEGLVRRALEIRRKRLPEGDSRTGHSLAVLGRCLLAQGKYPESEGALLEAVLLLERGGQPALPRLNTTIEDLARVYDAMDRRDAAARMRARLGR